jgi:MFS family permease
MDFANYHTERRIFRSSLAWVSILISIIAIVALVINLITGLIFNSFDLTNDLPDGLKTMHENYKIPGLMIFALIFAVLFFAALVWISIAILKSRKWAEELMSVYLWVFTIIIPLAYLLYWVGEKKELAKMKESLINNPEISEFYNAGNLALNIQLIFLGIAVFFAIVLLIKINLKLKN